MHNKPLAKVFHFDLYGKRQDKYEFLNNNSVSSVAWKELNYSAPYFFFVPKDFSLIEEYEAGIKINELFTVSNSGVESGKDNFIIKYNELELQKLEDDIRNYGIDYIFQKYKIQYDKAFQVIQDFHNSFKTIIQYRAFDYKYTFLSKNSQGVFWRPRYSTMRHLIHDNIAFIAKRGFNEFNSAPCFVTKHILDRRGWTRPGMQGTESVFPLYLYPETSELSAERRPNLNMEIVNKIANDLALRFVNDHELPSEQDTFSPLDLLDYIYAVLHSPNYREKYKEFLKIDFPRVPYPTDIDKFRKLVELGSQLRKIHLLESPLVNNFITEYPIDGSNTVEKIKYVKDKVYINDTQYFDRVPEVAWNFYIGGYQPAQKWLKDRKGRQLQYDDILHYQRIIVALSETAKLMKKIGEME